MEQDATKTSIECHRHAPVGLPRGWSSENDDIEAPDKRNYEFDHDYGWPVVYDGFWCGEWEQRPYENP
jgi:hypothetical protein